MTAMPRARTITIPATGEHELPTEAELTGRMFERLTDAGRCLFVELDIREAGRFNLYGDLCDAEGEVVGYVQLEVDLTAGVRDVALPIVLDRPDRAYEVCGLRVIRRRWS